MVMNVRDTAFGIKFRETVARLENAAGLDSSVTLDPEEADVLARGIQAIARERRR